MVMKAMARTSAALGGGVAVVFMLAIKAVGADDPQVTPEQIRQLQQQNEQLRQQLQKQQELIDSLTRKVSEIQDVNARRDNTDLKTQAGDADKEDGQPSSSTGSFHLGKVDISGEGGTAFFWSQSKGQTPNAEARIDEARFFIEAPIWNNVYFFSELNVATPETTDLNVRGGELYLDFENVSQLWGRDRLLNVRVGRFYIPFGEEYQNRFAIDNPLITRSVSDLWGEDEGLEFYGAAGRWTYVAAVQNGGAPTSRDFTADKSVAGRIGYDPAPWLHLSVSGMRTGDISVQGDGMAELWFGNGLIRSIGSSNTTRFHANLVEGDVQARYAGNQIKLAGGYLNYADNDPLGRNNRDVYYYYVEGTHDFTSRFYGAARFSQILANNGFPILGDGTFNSYFTELTTDYWRLSLGLGYRFSRNLIIKGEYSFNRGRDDDGDARNHEDLFALEAAYRF